jgi:hypothetical protein
VWLTRKEHFMYDNLPSDPEVRRVICKLKGIPYTDPEPPVEPAAARSARDVVVMVDRMPSLMDRGLISQTERHARSILDLSRRLRVQHR